MSVTVVAPARAQSPEAGVALLRRRRGVHALLPTRSDRPRERRRPADRLAPAGGRPGAAGGVSRSGGERLSALDADPDRRRALRPERARIAGGVRSGDRRDHLAPTARSLPPRRRSPAAARGAPPGGPMARPGGCCWSADGYLYALDAETGRRVSSFGLADQGRVDLDWEHLLAGEFDWTAGPLVVGDVVVVAGTTGGSGRRRHRAGGGPGGRARLRRAYRRAALDVPRGPAGRRVRRRYLGRRFRRLLRRSGFLVLPERRRGAGVRLRAAVGADRDGLRRPPAGRQPLLGQPRRPRRRHRRAGVALPDGAPRRLGVRHRRPAHPRRHHRRRSSHPRR